ncbi:MAG: hypothetical protein Ct9H300mP19_12990 [Dehalococcoidia bacterium]|nr:MAG: hypothetical protein Ct9H300mP19_12990 [Dehalococcoidia bacterium]
MGLSYEEDNSRSERLKRAITNPSKRTILIAVVIGRVALSPGMVKVFYTAQEGIGSITAEHDLTTNMSSVYEDIDNLEEKYVPPLFGRAKHGDAKCNWTPRMGDRQLQIWCLCSRSNWKNGRCCICRNDRPGLQRALRYPGQVRTKLLHSGNLQCVRESKDELRKVIDQFWEMHTQPLVILAQILEVES